MCSRELWEGWFVENDMWQTVCHLLTVADHEYMTRTFPTAKFVDEIYNEMRFIAPYSPEEMQRLRIFLMDKGNALHCWYILWCANQVSE